MKNILYRLTFVLLVAVLMVGCEEEPLIYDADNGLTLVQFNKASAVIPTPEGGASTTVKVLVSTKSSTERVIEVQVDEEAEIDEEMSTASADQYEVSDLVIPANSYEGTITITSNYEALPETGSTELVLDLVGLEGQDVSVDNGTVQIELFRKCDIVLAEFVGTWEGPGVWAGFYGGYQTEVVTSLNAEGELLIDGLTFQFLEDPTFWGEEIISSQPVKMIVDTETGEITIPEQYFVTTDYSGYVSDYTIKGTGNILNPCEKTMEIFPVLIMEDGTVIDGTIWGPRFVETIKLVQ